jgi:hypothetical protein
MTHTTIPAEIHLPAPRIFSLQGSFGKLRRLWIFLCWIMLSPDGGVQTHSAAGIIVSERQDYFEKHT